MRIVLEVFRRFAAISSVVLWLGGFTFYAGVVIPVGARVLHSHHRQGLITQQVTWWLNLIGIPALLILFWNVVATRRINRWSSIALFATWLGMVIVQAGLFLMHPVMDRIIDPLNGKILDFDHFESLHTIYGAISTVQWSLGVLHVIVLMYVWTLTPAHVPETIR